MLKKTKIEWEKFRFIAFGILLPNDGMFGVIPSTVVNSNFKALATQWKYLHGNCIFFSQQILSHRRFGIGGQ